MAYKEFTKNIYICSSLEYTWADTYLEARNAVAANEPVYSVGAAIGQYIGLGKYFTYRSTLEFNIGTIGMGSPVEYAALRLWPYAGVPALVQDFDLVLMNGQPDYPHDPVVQGDYNRAHYAGDGGSVAASTLVLDQYNDLIFNPTGRGWLNLGGMTKFMIMSSRDIAGSPPVGNEERIMFHTTNATGKGPKLVVRVTLSIPNPQTDDPTNITGAGAVRLNGTMVSSGYWLNTYGFQWKKGIGGTVYNNIVGGNVADVDTFFKDKTGWDITATYYYRAFGTNDAGTAYGDWVEVTFVAELANIRAENNAVFARTILYGEIVDLLGYTMVERGFEYKIQDAEPGADDTGTEIKEFYAGGFVAEEFNLRNKELYDQVEDTVWWFRTYCKDDGAVKHKASSWMKNLPTVTTQAMSNIDYNKADGNGNIISKGASDLTRRGFEVRHEYSGNLRDSWKFDIAGFEGELESETIENEVGVITSFYWAGDLIKTVLEIAGLGLGAYNITIGQMLLGWPVADDCLIEGKAYKCRAFASNEFGTVYGEEVDFSTTARTYLDEDTPVVGEISVIKNEVIENLPEGITASRRGFRYGTTEAADEFDVHENGSFTNGPYSMMLVDLLPDTTYYIYAYIVVDGTVYEGNLETLTTDPEGTEDEDEYPTPHYSPHGQDYREMSTKVLAEVLANQTIIDFSGGRKTLPIVNHLIQTNPEAKTIADNYLARFQLAKTRMNITYPTPLPFEREDTIDFSFGKVKFKENDLGIITFKEDGLGVLGFMDQITMMIKKINSVGLTKTQTSIDYTAVLDLEHE